MDLYESGSGPSGSFEPLDFAIREALHINVGGEVQRKLQHLKREHSQKEGRPVLLNGRMTLFLINEHMKLNDLDTDLLETEHVSAYK